MEVKGEKNETKKWVNPKRAGPEGRAGREAEWGAVKPPPAVPGRHAVPSERCAVGAAGARSHGAISFNRY